MSKYGNVKTTVDGITFDSQKEANRYCELKILQKAGEIENLELQKQYELIPAYYDENGRCVERACYYRADFVYWDVRKKDYIIEDVKGHRTKEYIIKRKLMLDRYRLRITEI